MKESDSRSSRRRSRHSTRSTSRERDRHTDRRERDRKDRDREREKERSRYRDTDRSYDRDYVSRHYHSKSPSVHSRYSHSKSKKSKKYRRRSSSRSDESSRSSYSSDSSKYSRRSSVSRSSRTSKKSSSRSRHTRGNSYNGNTSLAATAPSAAARPIDLHDHKVRAALETIEEDKFVPQVFYSTRDREAPAKPGTAGSKVIIDLNTETVSLTKPTEQNVEMETTNEIFHPNFLGDEQQKTERWIKRLFSYREKCFRE